MDNIIVSFNVIAPVFFLMVLGYFLVNYTSLADGKLTKQANAIVFKIFLPCMLFYNVYQSDIGSEIHSRIRLCIWAAGGLLILFVLLCLIVPRIVTQENQQGVVIQGIHDSDGGYDGIPGCGPVVGTAGISDSGCGIQLYHGTAGGSGWTACRAAGCVLIGAFDIYVVCDDIHIADGRIAWDLIY